MNFNQYIRPILGTIALLLGIAFCFIPAVPVLGIVGLFAGAFLLAPYVPFFAKLKEWVKSKDRSGKTVEVEDKLENLENEQIKKER
ncbi:hypothetical protein WJR50_00070 [Catalinimonas sp. 4WD22]|uniref:hypothetical protein n=1 Tax=Catalinimonas locisalis TaxID=3133978 RepID=UPI003100AD51